MAIDPLVERKIRSVGKKQNITPAYLADLLAQGEHGTIGIVGGKVRHITSGSGVKRYVEAQRATRSDIFLGPAVQTINTANPWTLGDAAGAHEARVAVIKSGGTKLAVSLAAQAQTDLAGRPLRKKA